LFGLTQSNPYKWIRLLLPVLDEALQQEAVCPACDAALQALSKAAQALSSFARNSAKWFNNV
jgi:hypothetical protein